MRRIRSGPWQRLTSPRPKTNEFGLQKVWKEPSHTCSLNTGVSQALCTILILDDLYTLNMFRHTGQCEHQHQHQHVESASTYMSMYIGHAPTTRNTVSWASTHRGCFMGRLLCFVSRKCLEDTVMTLVWRPRQETAIKLRVNHTHSNVVFQNDRPVPRMTRLGATAMLPALQQAR